MLAAVVAGCGGGGDAARTTATARDQTVTTIDAQELGRAGVLRVCATAGAAPYVTRSPRGWDGFEIAVQREIARRLELRPVFVPTTRTQLVGDLAAGRCDVAVGHLRVTYEDQRRIGVLGYVAAPLAYLVRDGVPAPAAPCPARLAVVTRTAAEEETADCPRTVEPTLAAAVRDLRSRSADVLFDDAVVARWYAQREPGLRAVPADGRTRYGIGYRKRYNSVFFAERGALLAMGDDGSFRRLMDRYGLRAARALGLP